MNTDLLYQTSGEAYQVFKGLVIIGGMVASALFFTACSGVTGGIINSSPEGYFELRGDAAGLEAYSDLIQGAIVNGKASPDVETSHYQLRKEQTRAGVVRFTNMNRAEDK